MSPGRLLHVILDALFLIVLLALALAAYAIGLKDGRRACEKEHTSRKVSATPLFREGDWIQIGLDAYAKRTETGIAFHFDGNTTGVTMRDLRWLNLGIHPVGKPKRLTPSEGPLVAAALDLDAVLPPPLPAATTDTAVPTITE